MFSAQSLYKNKFLHKAKSKITSEKSLMAIIQQSLRMDKQAVGKLTQWRAKIMQWELNVKA